MNSTALLRVSTLAAFFSVCAFAQRDLATLVGSVTDPTSAGIPNHSCPKQHLLDVTEPECLS